MSTSVSLAAQDSFDSQLPAPSKFAVSMKRFGRATVRGAQAVYRISKENAHFILPAVNGAVGHFIPAIDRALGIKMSFRWGRKDIESGDSRIAAMLTSSSFRENGGRLAIYVHGLMTDEVPWERMLDGSSGLAVRIAEETGIPPLLVRYNSGLHISTNGKLLSDIIEDLHDVHGDSIEELILIGHSMGGLVVRSASHYGAKGRKSWASKLSTVALLGAPNEGAPLEQVSNFALDVVKQISHFSTQAIGWVGDRRSPGIKDLRWGYLVDEDWKNETGSPFSGAHKKQIPPLPGVRYHIIVATLSKHEDSFFTHFFGDGMIPKPSGIGRVFNGSAQCDNVTIKTFPKTSHIGLIFEEEVRSYLIGLLGTQRI